ncbi:MAG: hypothetical protein JSR43_01400 [Proteobacteria bacterium]|jgi:hypothetical protein|nr:hypothetical protein [Pseudomonadota bacterium]
MTASQHSESSLHADPEGGRMKAGARIGLWIAACSALAAVALMYLSPHLMVELANRVWACF